MHSSRMCTVRFSGNPSGRVVCLGGCLSGRVSAGRGVSAYQGCLPRGCLFRGTYPTPLVNRITDRFKSITFAQTSFAGGNKVENYKYMDIESWHQCQHCQFCVFVKKKPELIVIFGYFSSEFRGRPLEFFHNPRLIR